MRSYLIKRSRRLHDLSESDDSMESYICSDRHQSAYSPWHLLISSDLPAALQLIFERSSDWIPSLNMLVLSFSVKKRSSQSLNRSKRSVSCAISPANFTVNLSTGALETLFTIDIVCVTTNCRVKDEWKRSWYKDNSFTKNLVRICFFERVRDSISAESETAWELAGMEVLRDKSHALPVLSLHRVMG